MIYAKTRVVDGLYTVKCFNEYGVDITASLDVSSEIYTLNDYKWTNSLLSQIHHYRELLFLLHF